ncbi:DUF3168 domain-containing protein [bacterium]|jgi:hypothetical protein|nr:DUF3168 domain-containing protein [bacterium]NBX48976.1 DUF3168 domain-containing protein [bacterium]
MSAAKAMRARLIGDATLTGLIGTRIYPGKAPQDPTLPYVVYHRISTTRTPTLNGPTLVPETRIQLDIIATSQASAELVATAIRNRIDGYTGTSASVSVLSSVVEDEMDMDETIEGSDSIYYRVVMDVLIQHRE